MGYTTANAPLVFRFHSLTHSHWKNMAANAEQWMMEVDVFVREFLHGSPLRFKHAWLLISHFDFMEKPRVSKHLRNSHIQKWWKVMSTIKSKRTPFNPCLPYRNCPMKHWSKQSTHFCPTLALICKVRLLPACPITFPCWPKSRPRNKNDLTLRVQRRLTTGHPNLLDRVHLTRLRSIPSPECLPPRFHRNINSPSANVFTNVVHVVLLAGRSPVNEWVRPVCGPWRAQVKTRQKIYMPPKCRSSECTAKTDQVRHQCLPIATISGGQLPFPQKFIPAERSIVGVGNRHDVVQ